MVGYDMPRVKLKTICSERKDGGTIGMGRKEGNAPPVSCQHIFLYDNDNLYSP